MFPIAAGRLFQILYLLLERERITAPELAERFEVSIRTIYRDIDALSAAGIPVYAAPGRNGGISLLEGCVLDRTYFTPEEQCRLLTAVSGLSQISGGASEEILAKLSAIFQQDAPEWLSVDWSGWGAGDSSFGDFDLLRRAIQQKHPVTFRYVGSRGSDERRKVLPARLVFKSRDWYLQGYCLKRKDYRTFKAGRLLDLQVEPEVFTQTLCPPSIDVDETNCPFITPLRLQFAPWMAYRVYDEFDRSAIHPQADGSFLVTVTMPEDQWLYGYLLSFGVSVEVLEPKTVRARLGILAREIWSATQNPDVDCQGFCDMINPSPVHRDTKEVFIMEEQFCQSCSMPLTPETLGTEADGRKNPHYCQYCYQNGSFTSNMTMEEMIDFCVPHMVQAHPGMTEEQARAQMSQFFPMLMRWRKNS